MKKLVYFILFLFFVNTSCFSQNTSGSISYEYAGNSSFPYRYKIIVKTYTEWLGSFSVDKCALLINFNGIDTTTIPRVNGPSVNCPADADGIMIGGCTGNIRYNVYETTYNFSGPGNYTITVEDNGRNIGICNVPSPSDDFDFFLSSELIISPFLGPNNGPAYNAVSVLCENVGAISYYNPIAVDSDGDSLSYELIPAMSFGSSIPGWTFPAASSSFSIDSNTGIVTWDSPVMYCTYIFDIRITEWRKIASTYYLMGKTMEDVWSKVGAFAGISDQTTSSTSLSIFPNPSNGVINMNIENGLENQDYQIVISNSIGQIIKTMDISNNTATINENELSSGIYFYSLSNKTQILNKGKFVILDGDMK